MSLLTAQIFSENRKNLFRMPLSVTAEWIGLPEEILKGYEEGRICLKDSIEEEANRLLGVYALSQEERLQRQSLYRNRSSQRISGNVLTEQEKKTIETLLGQDPAQAEVTICGYGQIRIVELSEYQALCADQEDVMDAGTVLKVVHQYAFAGDELIGNMTTMITTLRSIWDNDDYRDLCEMIPADLFDLNDIRRYFNPYWVMWALMNEPDKGKYVRDMMQRFNDLNKFAERDICMVTDVFIRDDYRRCGVFRAMLEGFKNRQEPPVIWLNLEPVRLEDPTQMPVYSLFDVGQIGLNEKIASRMGFTVDEDYWYRILAVLTNEDTMKKDYFTIRKCAYQLPQDIAQLLSSDGDLVAQGRKLQRERESEEKE